MNEINRPTTLSPTVLGVIHDHANMVTPSQLKISEMSEIMIIEDDCLTIHNKAVLHQYLVQNFSVSMLYMSNIGVHFTRRFLTSRLKVQQESLLHCPFRVLLLDRFPVVGIVVGIVFEIVFQGIVAPGCIRSLQYEA